MIHWQLECRAVQHRKHGSGRRVLREWTNDEGVDGGSVTTVTFEEEGGRTLVVLRHSYASKKALDAVGTGAAEAMIETFYQLDELLVALGESSGT